MKNEHFYIFENGETVAIQPKYFSFELAMEGYLADNPNLLSNESLDLKGPEVKELEKVTASKKRFDMLVQYENDTEAIVELKNVTVDENALQQLKSYLEEKRKERIQEEGEDNGISPIIGILIGPDFEEKVIQRIENNHLEGFIIYGVKLQRFYDENSWYIFTKWYIPLLMTGKKDYTKYILNNITSKPLGKGRLVFEVVKDYLSNNPNCTFNNLRQAFPDSLRKTKTPKAKLHVVELETNVASKDRYARYFKETLSCLDGDIVVSSQC